MNSDLARVGRASGVSVGRAVSLGLIYGFVTAFLAFAIAGGGDGWISVLISACGLVLVPMASAALVLHVQSVGKIMGAVVLALMALADILLIIFTVREGVAYVAKVGAVAPVLVFSWGVLWVGWQIAFVVIWAKRRDQK